MIGEPPFAGHPEAPPGQPHLTGGAPGGQPPPPPGGVDYFAPARTAAAPAWGQQQWGQQQWGAPPALPPAGYRPPVGPPGGATAGENESGLPLPLALTVTGIALLLSFGLSRLGRHADLQTQIDQQLRKGLVYTLLFYVALGLALLLFCVHRRVGLTWTRGDALSAVLLGLPLGGLGGALAIGLNSAIAGRLASDPNVELLVGGGGALRIALTLAVTTVLAPLVEEVLFRGVLAGTMLARGVGPAVWSSAVAFSVWHMSPEALRYYVFMGLLLAGLWRKRGLVASMSAHAAFNGALTLAAVAATTGGGHLLRVADLTVALPGGWHEARAGQQSAVGAGTLVDGPGGAALVVLRLPHSGPAPTSQDLIAGLRKPQAFGTRMAVNGAHVVKGAQGQAVVADVTVDRQPGHLVLVVGRTATYEVLVITGGSPAAEADWERIVSSVRTG